MTGSGTPSPATAQSLQQQLGDMDQEMMRISQDLPQMSPQQRQQVMLGMVALTGATGQFMDQLQQVADQLTPDQRQAVAGTLQQMQSNVQQLQQAVPGATPEATPMPGAMGPGATPEATPMPGGMGPGAVGMGQMAGEMDQIRQRLQDGMSQMDVQQMQTTVSSMAALMGTMGMAVTQMEPGLAQAGSERLQQLQERVAAIRGDVQQMETPGLGTPSPSASETPTAP